MSTRKSLEEFIRCVVEEKYAQAHKYLHQTLVEKYKNKIRKAAKKSKHLKK